MRKVVPLIASVFTLCLMAVPAAKAGTVSLSLNNVTPSTTTFNISGTYDSGVPNFSFNGVPLSAPGGNYSITFTLNTAVATNASFQAFPDNVVMGSNQGGLFLVDATMSISLNGGADAMLGTFMVEFDDTVGGNLGGLAFCIDSSGGCPAGPSTDWILSGQSLFTGSLSNTGTLMFINTSNARIDTDPVLSGYEINGVGPFAFTVGSGPTPTPEPASIFLLGTGLLGLGFAVRRKLRLI